MNNSSEDNIVLEGASEEGDDDDNDVDGVVVASVTSSSFAIVAFFSSSLCPEFVRSCPLLFNPFPFFLRHLLGWFGSRWQLIFFIIGHCGIFCSPDKLAACLGRS